jgi:hypothetical protein
MLLLFEFHLWQQLLLKKFDTNNLQQNTCHLCKNELVIFYLDKNVTKFIFAPWGFENIFKTEHISASHLVGSGYWQMQLLLVGCLDNCLHHQIRKFRLNFFKSQFMLNDKRAMQKITIHPIISLNDRRNFFP